MPTRIDYDKAFREILANASSAQRVSFHEIASAPQFGNVTVSTVKNHFKSFVDSNPSFLSCITGFYPKPETIVALVEQEIGSIDESKLDLANVRSREIVNGVARPIVMRFIHEGLASHLNPDKGSISIGIDVLTDFLIDDFAEFLKGAGNGLVSIAGSLNEMLLIRAMENAQMEKGKHFTRTGTDSKADIIVHSNASGRPNLAVEVKSYHARERLLRGLQDISPPKVGVGYFKDPAEFNPGRTRTLLQTQSAAVYMPRATLDRLSSESKGIKTMEATAFESFLYRPLEQFVTDMKGFYKTGALPRYA